MWRGGSRPDPARQEEETAAHNHYTYIGGVCCCCFAWRVGSRPQANKQQQSKSTPYSIQGVVLLTVVEGLGSRRARARRASRPPNSSKASQRRIVSKVLCCLLLLRGSGRGAPPGHQTTAKQVNPHSVQGVVLLAVVEGLGARRARARRATRPPNNSKASQPVQCPGCCVACCC